MKILTRDDTDYETEYVTREEAEMEIRAVTRDRDEARLIAEVYRNVWKTFPWDNQ